MHEEKKTIDTQETKQEIKQDPQEEKIKELIHDLQRLQAEFENYKKRVQRDQALFAQYACEGMIVKLLPILDHFELAIKQKRQDDDFSKGIELIYAQFIDILEKEGVKKIDAQGKYNPHFHEPLLQEQSEKEKSTILEILQSGYMLGEKVIRPAKVKISAGKKDGKE